MEKFVILSHLQSALTAMLTRLREWIDRQRFVKGPSADGEHGQVLATDGQGGRYWATVQTPNAVEDALKTAKEYTDEKTRGLLAADELDTAIDTALAEAKASGKFDGADGQDGAKGDKGDPGEKGADGVSVTHSWSGTTLTVTSASGTSSANLKGDKGDKGDTGANGSNGSNGVSCTHSWSGTTLSVTSASGTSSADLKGEKGDKGETGADGAPGYTPVKGTDYYTAADKTEMVNMVIAALPTWTGGTY